MNYFKQALRLIRINFIVIRYRLVLKNKMTRGARLRRTLEDLGPIFIKAGQILSTRRDFLPDDIAEELEKLQDQVPPFSGIEAKKIIEAALGASISTIFSEFDIHPLASASIAQVHAATLFDNRSVIIKVLRPNIRKMIDRDLDLLRIIAHLIDRYWARGRQFKPREILKEITDTLHQELDLMREGANASQLRRNFKNSNQLYIPEIYWAYCRTNILVMERIHGIPVNNIPALKNAGINMKKLAETGIEIFFTQVFRDSFFHADMHPGNIFVAQHPLESPQYIAVDFGITGSLSTKDQRYLAENMLAFFKRDYQRVAELHVASGWLPYDTRVDQFEGAIRAVCEPIFERPLKDISFGQLLLRLFQTAHQFNIDIQPQLILLQKTLLNIEGVGRQIYPDLDLWATAAPFLEKWLNKQIGVKAFLRRVRENLPYWSEKLPEIPELIYDVLNQTKKYHEEMSLVKKQQDFDTSKKNSSLITYFLFGLLSSGLLSSIVTYFFIHFQLN